MKWGLIARAEDRGLGIMTWEMHRHLRPDRTLLIDPLDVRFEMHRDRFPDATTVRFENGQLPERAVREWLDGLDVVYSAETFYDWRMVTWAREMGVATVCHGMPEFYKHPQHPEWRHPTRWWWPTAWLRDSLPDGPLVPVPVPDAAPIIAASPFHEGPLRVTHVVGHAAHADRNGTGILLAAMREVRADVTMTIWSQEPVLGSARNITFKPGPANRWDQYRDQHLLVLPRRYGGLCLPVQEALAAGCAVMMPDLPHNRMWPIVAVPCGSDRSILVPFGRITLVRTRPATVAAMIDQLAADRGALGHCQGSALGWAAENRWSVLADLYHRQLMEACL